MVELRHCDERLGRFLVINLFRRPELNVVYRYFLHQNPGMCVKDIVAVALAGPR